jgi:hypothetical protein
MPYPFAAWRRLLARETRSFLLKESLKFILLTIGALSLGWALAFVSALFHLENPLTIETLPARAGELFALLWNDPYRWTIGLIRADPVHAVSGLIVATIIVVAFMLLRRGRRRLREQSQFLNDAAIYQALVTQAGLGGRWPHARPDGTGAPWQDLASEILRHHNDHLYILGANGIDTFGRQGSPLYDTLQQFRGTVRVILVSPRSKEVIGRALALGTDPQEYKNAIDVSVRRLRDLHRQQHSIEGRYYGGQPNWKLIVTSRTVWMQYYMPGRMHVDQTPCWRFDLTPNDAGLYHYFSMEFDRVWRRCEDEQMDLH